MKPNRPVQKSKMFALHLDEIAAITKKLNESNLVMKRFLFNCLVYGGYRTGELLHQQKEWIHINDEYAKSIEMDYVQIPERGQFCSCRACKLQTYLEQESSKEGVVYNKVWYEEIIKKFNPDIIDGRYWKPKTIDGARKIPILYDDFKNELIDFYQTKGNNKLDYSHQWIWEHIKEISIMIWGYTDVPSKSKDPLHEPYRRANRRLYPHALRATAASLWALKGINATALKEIMGWSSVAIADIYVMSDEKQALLTCKALVEKENKV